MKYGSPVDRTDRKRFVGLQSLVRIASEWSSRVAIASIRCVLALGSGSIASAHAVAELFEPRLQLQTRDTTV